MRAILPIIVLSISLAAAGWRANQPDGPALPEGTKADLILVEKGERRLTLLNDGQVLKTYRVSLGREPVGPKQREGDNRTPEGRYLIDFRKPDSAYHRALHVSYPDATDRERASASHESPGKDIMVHGIRNGLGWLGRGHRLMDWTAGCIAVTNHEIEEIWRAAPNGTPIEIRP